MALTWRICHHPTCGVGQKPAAGGALRAGMFIDPAQQVFRQ